jgi:hypothetical protein
MILEIGAACYRNPLNYTENGSVPKECFNLSNSEICYFIDNYYVQLYLIPDIANSIPEASL